jgi:hypothetical protein
LGRPSSTRRDIKKSSLYLATQSRSQSRWDGRPEHDDIAFIAPELVTPALLTALKALTPLDPMHMPDNLASMHAIVSARPMLPQVACFDTAFHHAPPPVAKRFALPHAVSDAGVRRYGFHGLSYEFIADRLTQHFPAFARGRVIVAQLGSGASLCALRNGHSLDTTIGFSALDGLVMATRCGSLDPEVILYLGRQGHSFAGPRLAGQPRPACARGARTVHLLKFVASPNAHTRIFFGVSTRCQSGFLGNPNDRAWLAAPGYDATRPSSPKAIEEVSIRYWPNGIDASISRRRGK